MGTKIQDLHSALSLNTDDAGATTVAASAVFQPTCLSFVLRHPPPLASSNPQILIPSIMNLAMPWIFPVRLIQAVFGVIVLGLAAYGIPLSFLFSSLLWSSAATHH